MANTFEKVINALTRESGFEAGYSTIKRTSGPGVSGEQESDAACAWKDKYLYLLADRDNTKKRLARISSLETESQITELLRDVLPVADGLDLILTHMSGEDDSLNIFQGIKGVGDILNQFLVKYNVTVIDALGDVFDPDFHEALGMTQYPSAAPNTVVRVKRKGYLYRGKLLRPAQVLVATKKEPLLEKRWNPET